MAINVTLGEAKTQEEKPFPKLMRHPDGCVVFFHEHGKGICLIGDIDPNGTKANTFGNDWGMRNFTDYNEPITIQNA